MKEPTQEQQRIYVPRQQYEHLSFQVLQDYLEAQKYNTDSSLIVVGIANGGNIFAQYLGMSLECPVVLLHPNQKPMDGRTFDLLEDRRILLVDDISDSGNTLKSLRSYLTMRGGSVKTATLFERKGTICSPDYVGHTLEGSEWLVFWWEPEYIWTKEDLEREHVI